MELKNLAQGEKGFIKEDLGHNQLGYLGMNYIICIAGFFPAQE